MSDTEQKPLDPDKLGDLYPTVKTYDEIQTEREQVRRVRQSWLPKYPKLTVIFIMLGLAATGWLIIISVPYMMSFSIMAGVFGALFLFLLWAYLFITSVPKIKTLLDQISGSNR